MMNRGIVASSVLTLAGLLVAFASCADTENGAAVPEDRETSVPPNPQDAADEGAIADGGCDGSDPSCVTHVVSCDEVDWCGVETPVSPFHSLTALWGTSANDVWAVGSGGTILHYDGATWTPTPTGVKNTFYSIWGSGPNDIYTVSTTHVILHGTGFFGGTAEWKNVPSDLEEYNGTYVRAVWGSSKDDVRLGSRAYDFNDPSAEQGAGDQFTKYLKEDGSIGWQSRAGTGTIYSIWGSSADDVWMVADNYVYAKHQRALTLHGKPIDGGVPDAGHPPGSAPDRLTWTEVDSQANVTLESVWGSSANDVWTVGGVGTIRHITQGDVRWQKVSSPVRETLHSIWGAGPNDIWAVGDSGTIIHYDGTEFKTSTAQFKLGKKPDLHGVWGSGPNDVWIVGDGIVLHFTGRKGGK